MKIASHSSHRILAAVSLAVASLISLSSLPAQTPPPSSSITVPISSSEKDFLVKAAAGGMTEVQLGQLAADKGTSSEVKHFGSHMVMDHGNINDELKGLAEKKACSLPTTLDSKHQAMVDRLSKLSGSDFDQAYVKAMVKAHKKDAAEFETMSNTAQDPDVKAFAAKTLPTIKEHLTAIEKIQSTLK